MASTIPTSVKAYLLSKGIKPKAVVAGKIEGKKEEKPKTERMQAERNAPIVKNIAQEDFGDLPCVMSQYKTDRTWSNIGSLTKANAGELVWIRGRCHTVRSKGNTCFILVRRGTVSVQASAFVTEDNPQIKELIKFAAKVTRESIIDVCGTVAVVPGGVNSATQTDVEIQIKKLFVVSLSTNELPFQLDDANRRMEGKEGEITVSQAQRLDNRVLDLRTTANHAIFTVQSYVCNFYRQYFHSLGFIEIHSPKTLAGASEGGSEVFHLDYFGRPACLAQSPQLFKQMAVVGDLHNVFEIGPVFRAEDSRTHRHMCEFTGLDFEMEIKEHYHEVLRVIGNCFVYIFDNLNKHCQHELAAINAQYPFEPLKYRPMDQTLVMPFTEAVAMLREAGEKIGDFDDFNTPQEKLLGKLVLAKYGTQFYVVDKYPLAVRPFYTMPCPNKPGYSNSYDIMLRGEEIMSGAQRVHDIELLKERATHWGIPHVGIQSYIDSFSMGAYPHGGGGIGLERVVMLFCGLDNIRKTAMFPRTPTRLTP